MWNTLSKVVIFIIILYLKLYLKCILNYIRYHSCKVKIKLHLFFTKPLAEYIKNVIFILI